MKKEKKYFVIGGQYEDYCYGGTPTLIGAKRLAGKHMEYHDNFAGWVRPSIYRAEDTVLEEQESFYANGMRVKKRVPKWDAEPIA